MAILVSKAAASTTTDANTNVYNLGSKDSENVIFGVDSSSETFQLSGTNKVTILDVSNGDKVVHSGLSSSGVQAKVTGNTVTLSDGTNDKLVLGALAGGESVTVEFSDGKVVTIAASSATTPVYTVVQSGKSTTLNGTAASVTDSTAPAAVDLASTDGIQATTSITVNAAEASAGKSIASAIQAPTALDIASIKIVLSGAGLDVTGSIATDQLVLDSAKYLDADFTSGSSAVTINQITSLDYAYTASNKTLLITKNGGGALTATDVDNIVAGVKFKTAQADGNRIATLSYVDIAGNEGTSAAVTIAVDKTAPIAPTTLNLATADDSGINTTDDITSITTGLSIDGVAVTGESIQLYDGGTPISGAVATASNNAFTIDVALTEGSHTITAKATDLAGNTGDASSSLHIVVDTTAPSAPTSVAVTTLGGTVTSNTITETNTNLTASATITANQGATVAYLKVGSTIIASDTSIASGDTSVTFDLGQSTIDGLQSKIPLGGGVVSVELRDAAGNSVTSSANNPTLAEAPVRLIKNDGTIKLYATLDANSTLSTSLSIESALTEADNGSVIELAPGTYYAGTGTQSGIAALVSDYGKSGNPYVINKAVTIRGLDDPSTSSTIDTTFSLSGSTGFEILGKIPGMVTFENIKFLDGAYGVYVRGDAGSSTTEYNSGATVVLGGLTIRNSEFDNQGSSGLGVMLNNEPSSLGNLIIENVKFDQHANSTNSNGQSIFHEGIMSFGFDGTASLSNVQVIGTTGTSNPLTSPYYGIQIQGALGEQLTHTGQSAYTDPNSRWYQMGPTLGTVTLNNVDFSGNFQRGALGVSKYANIDGLAGPNPLGQPIDAVDFTNATVTNTTPGYAQFFTEGLASSYDASKFGFVGGVRVLQGDLSSQTVTNNIIKGTDGADGINGLAGNDKLYGGAGNDTIIGGAGADYIDVGEGADTVVEYVIQGTSTDSVGTASNSGTGKGADTINGFDLGADTLLVVATNLLSFVHGTDTEIGTATGTANLGVVGDFAANVGLIDFGANSTNDYNDATDGAVAINFTSPVGTFNKANFESRIQYNLTAGSAAATLTGGALNDTIAGGAGSDVLSGSAGDDILTGNAGEDYLISANGSDTLVGGTGADYLYAKNGDASSVTYMFGGGVTSATNGVYAQSTDTITPTKNVISAQSVTSFNNITAASSTFFDNANVYRSKAGTHIMVASNEKDIFVFKTAGTQANPANPAAGSDYADYNNASHATNTIYNFNIGTDSIIAIDYTAGSDHIFYGVDKSGGHTADGALVQTQASSSGWTWTGSATSGILAYAGNASDTLDDFSIHLIGVQGNITDVDSFFPTGI